MRSYNPTGARHWSASSEKYTTGDVLLRYLRTGWEPSTVQMHVHSYRGGRCGGVCEFVLKKDHRILIMSVVANPIVIRLVEQYGLALAEKTAEPRQNNQVLTR
jgi:hypothetical protein